MNKNEKNEELTLLNNDELDAVSGGARAGDCVHEWVDYQGNKKCSKCGLIHVTWTPVTLE